MSKPKVIVVGASGRVGKATLAVLAASYAEAVDIFAGTRTPTGMDVSDGVGVVAADMGAEASVLAETLKGMDRAFLVTPGAENRVDLVLNALEACKLASVSYVLVVSVLTGGPHTYFDNQFRKIEAATKESGLRYTIVRLNYFADNVAVRDGVISDPRDPKALIAFGHVGDTAKACAALLACAEGRHLSKTYSLVSPPTTFQQIAHGRNAEYRRVSYSETRSMYLDWGMEAWQADGLMELYRSMDEGKLDMASDDVKTILGVTATPTA